MCTQIIIVYYYMLFEQLITQWSLIRSSRSINPPPKFLPHSKNFVRSLHHIYMFQEPKGFGEHFIWCAGQHFNNICLYDQKRQEKKPLERSWKPREPGEVLIRPQDVYILLTLIMAKHNLASTWVHWKWLVHHRNSRRGDIDSPFITLQIS